MSTQPEQERNKNNVRESNPQLAIESYRKGLAANAVEKVSLAASETIQAALTDDATKESLHVALALIQSIGNGVEKAEAFSKWLDGQTFSTYGDRANWLLKLKLSGVFGPPAKCFPNEVLEAIKAKAGKICNDGKFPDQAMKAIEESLHASRVEKLAESLVGLGSASEVREWSKIIVSAEKSDSTLQVKEANLDNDMLHGLKPSFVTDIAAQIQSERDDDKKWRQIEEAFETSGVADESLRTELVKRLRAVATLTENPPDAPEDARVPLKLAQIIDAAEQVYPKAIDDEVCAKLEKSLTQPRLLADLIQSLASHGSPTEVREWAKIIAKAKDNEHGGDDDTIPIKTKDAIAELRKKSIELNSLLKAATKGETGEHPTGLSQKLQRNFCKRFNTALQKLDLTPNSLHEFAETAGLLLAAVETAIEEETRVQACRVVQINHRRPEKQPISSSGLAAELKQLKERMSEEAHAFMKMAESRQEASATELVHDFETAVDRLDRQTLDGTAFIEPVVSDSKDVRLQSWGLKTEFSDFQTLCAVADQTETARSSSQQGGHNSGVDLVKFPALVQNHLTDIECLRISGLIEYAPMGTSSVDSESVSIQPDRATIEDTIKGFEAFPKPLRAEDEKTKQAGPIKMVPKDASLDGFTATNLPIFLGMLKTAASMPARVLAAIFMLFAPFILFGLSNPLKTLVKGTGTDIELNLYTVGFVLLVCMCWYFITLLLASPIQTWFAQRSEKASEESPTWLANDQVRWWATAVFSSIGGLLVICVLSLLTHCLFANPVIQSTASTPYSGYRYFQSEQTTQANNASGKTSDQALLDSHLVEILDEWVELLAEVTPSEAAATAAAADATNADNPAPAAVAAAATSRQSAVKFEDPTDAKKASEFVESFVAAYKPRDSFADVVFHILNSTTSPHPSFAFFFEDSGQRKKGLAALLLAGSELTSEEWATSSPISTDAEQESLAALDKFLLQYLGSDYPASGKTAADARDLLEAAFKKPPASMKGLLARERFIHCIDTRHKEMTQLMMARERDGNLKAECKEIFATTEEAYEFLWQCRSSLIQSLDSRNSLRRVLVDREFNQILLPGAGSDGTSTSLNSKTNPTELAANLPGHPLGEEILTAARKLLGDNDVGKAFVTNIVPKPAESLIEAFGKSGSLSSWEQAVKPKRDDEENWNWDQKAIPDQLQMLYFASDRADVMEQVARLLSDPAGNFSSGEQKFKEFEKSVKNAKQNGLSVTAASKRVREWQIADELRTAYIAERSRHAEWPEPKRDSTAAWWLKLAGLVVVLFGLAFSVIWLAWLRESNKTESLWTWIRSMFRTNAYMTTGTIAIVAAILTIGFSAIRFQSKFGPENATQMASLAYPPDLDLSANPVPLPERLEVDQPAWTGLATFHLFDRLAPRMSEQEDFPSDDASVWASLLLFAALLTCFQMAIFSHGRSVDLKRHEANQFFKQKLISDFRKQVSERQRDSFANLRDHLTSWIHICFREIEFSLVEASKINLRRSAADEAELQRELGKVQGRQDALGKARALIADATAQLGVVRETFAKPTKRSKK